VVANRHSCVAGLVVMLTIWQPIPSFGGQNADCMRCTYHGGGALSYPSGSNLSSSLGALGDAIGNAISRSLSNMQRQEEADAARRQAIAKQKAYWRKLKGLDFDMLSIVDKEFASTIFLK